MRLLKSYFYRISPTSPFKVLSPSLVTSSHNLLALIGITTVAEVPAAFHPPPPTCISDLLVPYLFMFPHFLSFSPARL